MTKKYKLIFPGDWHSGNQATVSESSSRIARLPEKKIEVYINNDEEIQLNFSGKLAFWQSGDCSREQFPDCPTAREKIEVYINNDEEIQLIIYLFLKHTDSI